MFGTTIEVTVSVDVEQAGRDSGLHDFEIEQIEDIVDVMDAEIDAERALTDAVETAIQEILDARDPEVFDLVEQVKALDSAQREQFDQLIESI